MTTRIDEIAPDIYRLSTLVPDIGPSGFTFNQFLGEAPGSQVAHGAIGCMVSLAEMADRPPRSLSDGEVIKTGSKCFRHIDTPHVPHGWEAGVLYEETTGTLLCGDLFTHLGDGPALTEADVVGPAAQAEDIFRASSPSPSTPGVVERLADLEPRTLALMHGSSFVGDCKAALRALADDYRQRIKVA